MTRYSGSRTPRCRCFRSWIPRHGPRCAEKIPAKVTATVAWEGAGRVRGMGGRHSAGVPSAPAPNVAWVVAAGLALAAIVGAVVAWFIAGGPGSGAAGSGAPASRSVAGAPGASASAAQPNTASSAPVAQPSRRATRSPEATPAQGRQDPLGAGAASYL